jgi:hypothetical protein
VPLPHRNRRDLPNPAYFDEKPLSEAQHTMPLADWVAELQMSVRRARQRRRLAIATGSAAALMITTVGVALATDRPGADGAQISSPMNRGAVNTPALAHPIQQETPPQRPGGLALWARGTSDVVAAGQQLGIEVGWRDGAGRLTGLVQDWGDGTVLSARETSGCATRGTHGSRTAWHTWRTPGTYTVRLSATTGSCGAGAERRVVEFTVQVVAPGRRVITAPGPAGAQPRPVPHAPSTTSVPSPTAAPTETPSPTPSPTPAPTGTPSPTPSPTPAPTETTTEPVPSPTEGSSSTVTPEPTPTG